MPHSNMRRDKATAQRTTPPNDGTLRVGCEKRRGGMVTLVYGLLPSEIPAVGAELRRRCATGGSAKEGIVSLQGDCRDAVLTYFAERKRRAKKMGG